MASAFARRLALSLAAVTSAGAANRFTHVAAQGLDDPTIEYCSKYAPEAPALSGHMGTPPEGYTKLEKERYGVVLLRKGDFGICPACPGEIKRDVNGLCSKAGSQTPPAPAVRPDNTQDPSSRSVQVPPPPSALDDIKKLPGFCIVMQKALQEESCPAPPVLPLAAPGDVFKTCADIEALDIQGSGTVSSTVLPYLIASFAAAKGLQVSRAPQISAEEDKRNRIRIYLLRREQGSHCFKITVRYTGSDTAGEALNDKVAQIGVSSRIYPDDEIRQFAPGLSDFSRPDIEQVVGLDAVAIVVNKSNPVRALGLCQIARMFGGEIRDWREVGGAPGPVVPHVRMGSSGTFEAFRDLVLDECSVRLSRTVSVIHENYERLQDAVATEVGGIGFSAAAFVSPRVKSVTLGGACGIEQTLTPFAIKSEDHPLSRRLFMFTPVQLVGLAREFADYSKNNDRIDDALSKPLPPGLASDASGRAITQEILLDQTGHGNAAATAETKEDRKSARDFETLTAGADRLSSTYRFRFGSGVLDTKARQDIVRLFRYFQKNPTLRTVLLAGFTDNVGDVRTDLNFGQARADAVLRELETLGIRTYAPNIKAIGFGKILPVVCNEKDNSLGQQKNRRVEVWLTRG